METPKTTVVTDGQESSLEGLEGLLRTEDALAKRSVRFLMVKMFGATRRTFIPRSGSLVARPKLPFVFGFLVTAIAVLAALSWFHRNQIDEARSAQVILNQIAVLTRDFNNLTLAALQKQNLTPEADTEMLEVRHALPKAVLAAHLHAYHTAALERVWLALDSYITSAGRQWFMMQFGDFDEAKQVDIQEVSPQFDSMQHQVQIAIEGEDNGPKVLR